ncbi:MAG: hypothetical protein MUF44_06420 [Hydrogenophaga sp.]|nr:hypothetical protein [Hydrogenophaga sp.]
MKKPTASLAVLAAALALAGCVTPGGGMVSTGTSATAATGAAAGGTSAGANANLERCAAPLGTLAVDDGRGKEWYASFGAATQVTSIEPLLRLAVQQSNCFVITSVGNNRTESRLSAITDKQRNSGAIAGSFERKASVVTLTMFDIRSGVQIAISEGNSTSTNFGAALGAFGGGAAGGLSGFSRTPEGKATVAAFMDAYNSMVISLRNYKAQEVKGGLGKGGTLKVGQ